LFDSFLTTRRILLDAGYGESSWTWEPPCRSSSGHDRRPRSRVDTPVHLHSRAHKGTHTTPPISGSPASNQSESSGSDFLTPTGRGQGKSREGGSRPDLTPTSKSLLQLGEGHVDPKQPLISKALKVTRVRPGPVPAVERSQKRDRIGFNQGRPSPLKNQTAQKKASPVPTPDRSSDSGAGGAHVDARTTSVVRSLSFSSTSHEIVESEGARGLERDEPAD
jgi:hypothetical protein